MMSISPTGLRQRRARMRKPLAMRSAAARLSAEMPVRNATWRSGCGASRRGSAARELGAAPAAVRRAVAHRPWSRSRLSSSAPLIDVAAGLAGDGGDLGHRLLDRQRGRAPGAAARRVSAASSSPCAAGGAMTITISPRGSARRGDLARQGRRDRRAAPPRSSLVSSRQIAASRGPSPSARSASAAASRGPVSNRTSVAGMRVELGDAGAPRRLLRRQEALEEEPVGRQRAHHQRREHRGRARQRRHARALLARRAHQLVAGVGDQRRAGIGNQRNGRAFGEPRQQLRPRLGGVVVVIGRQRGGDGVVVERACG